MTHILVSGLYAMVPSTPWSLNHSIVVCREGSRAHSSTLLSL